MAHLALVSLLSACITYSNQPQLYTGSYDRKEAARTYLDIGLLRLSQQSMAEAELYLFKAYKLNQNKLTTIEAIALLYQLKQNYKKSAIWFDKALAIDKTNGRLNYNYGISLYQLKFYKRALNAFLTASRDNHYINHDMATNKTSDASRRQSLIWKNIARCYLKLGNRKAARYTLNKARQRGRNKLKKQNTDK